MRFLLLFDYRELLVFFLASRLFEDCVEVLNVVGSNSLLFDEFVDF